jgi:hypothetical protein
VRNGGTLFQKVGFLNGRLRINCKVLSHVLKDILMPIEVEISNIRVSKSQSNILEALYN